MASGWTNSGIDWTSTATMRNSRTEDIVREIYLAVNERDYWISYFNPSWKLNQRALPSLDRIGRMRTDQQLRYIYDTVKLWITPFQEIINDVLSDFFTINEACFLDETSDFNLDLTTDPDYKPFKSNSIRWFGKKNLDYSEGGTLEGLLGYDLGFFRNHDYVRNNLEFLHIVYTLLNLDLKISNAYSYIATTTYPNGRSEGYIFDPSYTDFYGFTLNLVKSLRWGATTPNQDGLNQVIDDYNNIDISTLPKLSAQVKSENLLTMFGRANGSGGASVQELRVYGSYIMTGFNGNVFDMTKMDLVINEYVSINKVGKDSFFDFLPTAGANRTLGINTFSPTLETIQGDTVFAINTICPQPWPYAVATPDGVVESSRDDLEGLPVVYLRIDNQEGFLNYYTEPTP